MISTPAGTEPYQVNGNTILPWRSKRAEVLGLILVAILFTFLPHLSYTMKNNANISQTSEIEQLKITINTLSKAQEAFVKKNTEENALFSSMLIELRDTINECEFHQTKQDAKNGKNIEYKLKVLSQNGFHDKNYVSSENVTMKSVGITSEIKVSVDSIGIGDRKLMEANITTDNFCERLPILSPMNSINNFQYDERVDRVLNQIQGLSSAELLEDHHTPQYKAACWILYDDELQMAPTNKLFIQRYVSALLLFNNQKEKETVQLPFETCDHPRFVCNDERHIIRIFMRSQGIVRTIPSEISYLLHLEHLDLSGNKLTGTIPEVIGRLENLSELYLNENVLSGTIPSEFGMLINSLVISLQSNNLEGTIPSDIGKLGMLQDLQIQSNSISGSIPNEMYDCKQLKILDLRNNHLTGSISSEMQHLKALETLNIENNKLTGQIPSEIGTLSVLKDLWLGRNDMTGTIPRQLGNLSSAERIILENNFLTGTLPNLFDNLSELNVINLAANHLSGSIPVSFWDGNYNVAALLEDNNFVGHVPEDFCANVPNFKVDNSPWFLDEAKVKCQCCGDIYCNFWNIENPTVAGTVRPKCPKSNIVKINFDTRYWIRDNAVNETFYEFVAFNLFDSKSFCLSPSGCYSFYDKSPDRLKYNMGYSSSLNALLLQDSCGAVNICGTIFDKDHSKRNGLNHLTQIAVEDLSVLKDSTKSQYNALCSIMTEDPLFHELSICDGTLLQRYVLTLFLHANKRNFLFEDVASKPTCKWPGVFCDSNEKFVEHLDFRNANLTGTLTSEIGLLTRLQTIIVAENELRGTIDGSIFYYLPNLEYFDAAKNKIKGKIPKDLLKIPSLKHLNISTNLLEGNLPTGIVYSDSLTSFDLGNNLLQGIISTELFSCIHLDYLDLSRNNFVGEIPVDIGNLNKLKVIKFYKNSFTGSIPVRMFDVHGVEQLMLHSNRLTGSIPTEIGTLTNLTKMSMSHNLLKGNIPMELQNLKMIDLIQLHQNRLTGTAPRIKARLNHINSYITDCGDPSFLLDLPLECESCTMCCNSENKCQENFIWNPPIWVYPSLVALIAPVLIGMLVYVFFHRASFFQDNRHPLSIYRDDSVYCFIFSKSIIARLVHFFTVLVQFLLFLAFMWASDSSNEDSDFEFNFRCTDRSLDCIDLNNDTMSGWALIIILNILYLGVDVVHGMLQIRKGVLLGDLELLVSGCVLLFLTILAMGTAMLYNYALAETTTNMIVNAVILLFINDIDEKFMTVLKSIVPLWIDSQLKEVKRNMARKIDPNHQSSLEIVVEEEFTHTEKNILKCVLKDWTDKKIQDCVVDLSVDFDDSRL